MTFEGDSLGLDGQVGGSVLLGDVDNYVSNLFLRVFRVLFLLEDIAVDIGRSIEVFSQMLYASMSTHQDCIVLAEMLYQLARPESRWRQGARTLTTRKDEESP